MISNSLARLYEDPADDEGPLDWGRNPSGARMSGSNRRTFTLRGLGENLFDDNRIEFSTLDGGFFIPNFDGRSGEWLDRGSAVWLTCHTYDWLDTQTGIFAVMEVRSR